MTTPAAPVVEVEIMDAIADLVETIYPDPATFAVIAGGLKPTPDAGAALNLTLVGDDARQSLRRYALQVRTRGGADQRDVTGYGEAIADLLHGRRDTPAGDAVIAHIWRISSIGLGQDTSKRWERSDNYVLDVSTVATQWIDA